MIYHNFVANLYDFIDHVSFPPDFVRYFSHVRNLADCSVDSQSLKKSLGSGRVERDLLVEGKANECKQQRDKRVGWCKEKKLEI